MPTSAAHITCIHMRTYTHVFTHACTVHTHIQHRDTETHITYCILRLADMLATPWSDIICAKKESCKAPCDIARRPRSMDSPTIICKCTNVGAMNRYDGNLVLILYTRQPSAVGTIAAVKYTAQCICTQICVLKTATRLQNFVFHSKCIRNGRRICHEPVGKKLQIT